VAREITIDLSLTCTPAFYALLHCAEVIAETEREERAGEWAGRIVRDDFDLFCRIQTDKRPRLRLIKGDA
jgi:hypothetical protein